MKEFLGFIVVVVVLIWGYNNFIDDPEKGKEKVEKFREDVSRYVDQNTVTGDEAIKKRENIEVYRSEYEDNGYEATAVRDEGYYGYVFHKGDFAFTLVFNTKLISRSDIYIENIVLYSENKPKGIDMVSKGKDSFDFYYLNPDGLVHTATVPFKKQVRLSSLPLELQDISLYASDTSQLQEIIDIFKYCKKLTV